MAKTQGGYINRDSSQFRIQPRSLNFSILGYWKSKLLH